MPGGFPVPHRARPLLRHVVQRQLSSFHQRLVVRKDATRFAPLPPRGVQRLARLGGREHPADPRWLITAPRQALPGGQPAPAARGGLGGPARRPARHSRRGCRAGRGAGERPESRRAGRALGPGAIWETMADRGTEIARPLRPGQHGGPRCGPPWQASATRATAVRQPPIFSGGTDGYPALGPCSRPAPEPPQCFCSCHGEAQCHRARVRLHRACLARLDHHGLQGQARLARGARPGLPGPPLGEARGRAVGDAGRCHRDASNSR